MNLRNVSSLRVRITRLNRLREPGGSGGFKEITIPGVHLRQDLLRPPVVTAGALAGRPLGVWDSPTYSSAPLAISRSSVTA